MSQFCLPTKVDLIIIIITYYLLLSAVSHLLLRLLDYKQIIKRKKIWFENEHLSLLLICTLKLILTITLSDDILYIHKKRCKSNFYCHTRTQLTIPDCLIIILDDQLGPLVALKSSSYRPAGRLPLQ